eukprot:gene14227-10169_t
MSKVVIGGGISGVCCAQELARLNPSEEIILITAAETLLEAKSVFAWSKYLEEIDIFEKTADQFILSNPNIRIIQDIVDDIVTVAKQVHLKNSNTFISYSRLCICTGVRPKLIADHERIVGIRDLFSVHTLVHKMQTARTVVVVGNGGIALELAHELKFMDVHWVVRENYIGAAFFDESASDFIMPQLRRRAKDHMDNGPSSGEAGDGRAPSVPLTAGRPSPMEKSAPSSAAATATATATAATTVAGCGLGPAWLTKTKFHDQLPEELRHRRGYLQMHFESEVAGYLDSTHPPEQCQWQWIDLDVFHTDPHLQATLQQQATAWLLPRHETASGGGGGGGTFSHPFYIITTQGEIVGCDVVISATGVQANHASFLDHLTQQQQQPPSSDAPAAAAAATAALSLDKDGFILVNERMESSLPGIFAAGDCCTYRPASLRETHNHLNGVAGLSPPHFFQMRLWTQARIMGTYAAQCLCEVEGDYGIDQHLELFAHVTRFFGLKVVLLGRYNAQGLGMEVERIAKRTVLQLPMQDDCDTTTKTGTPATATATGEPPSDEGDASDEQDHHHSHVTKRPKLHETAPSAASSAPSSSLEIWSRVTPHKQFIKLMVCRGRIIGALLIGDTEMEEVFENLILNQLDVTSLGPDLLDPDHDLTDYFD